MKSKFYFYAGLVLLFVLKKLIRTICQLEVLKSYLDYWQKICAIRHIGTAKISPKAKLSLLQSLEKPVS